MSPSAQPRAIVVQVVSLAPHPNADKLDLLWLSDHEPSDRIIAIAITGKHYRLRQRGIFIPAGLTIPGWMAEDMWLFGRGPSMKQRFNVGVMTLQGLESPGLFCGEVYRKVADDPRSVERYEKLSSEGGDVVIDTVPLLDEGIGKPKNDAWITWPFWRSWWKLGDDVTAYLGLTQFRDAAS